MSRYSYICIRNGSVTILDGTGGVQDSPAGESGNECDAVIVSRLCADTLFLDFPAVNGSEAQSMIRYGLDAHYPGNLDDVSVTYGLFRSRTAVKAAVFLFPLDIKKEILARIGKKTAFPALSLVFTNGTGRKNRTEEQDRKKITGFVFPDCIELVLSEKGIPSESAVLMRNLDESHSIPADEVRSLMRQWLHQDCISWFVPAFELDAVRMELEKSLFGIERDFQTFESLAGAKPDKNSILTNMVRKDFILPPKLRIGLLTVIIAVLGVLLGLKSLAEKERTLESLKSEYMRYESEYREMSVRDTDIRKLSERMAFLEKKRPVDIYGFFSVLSRTLTSDVVLTSLNYRNEKFELEGVAESPFRLMERFTRNERYFSRVEISRVTPLPDGKGSRFFLTGVYNGE